MIFSMPLLWRGFTTQENLICFCRILHDLHAYIVINIHNTSLMKFISCMGTRNELNFMWQSNNSRYALQLPGTNALIICSSERILIAFGSLKFQLNCAFYLYPNNESTHACCARMCPFGEGQVCQNIVHSFDGDTMCAIFTPRKSARFAGLCGRLR